MFIIKFWEELSDENKILAKKIGLASIGLYILFQLITFIFPIAITTAVAYWAYKKYIDPNPKVLK